MIGRGGGGGPALAALLAALLAAPATAAEEPAPAAPISAGDDGSPGDPAPAPAWAVPHAGDGRASDAPVSWAQVGRDAKYVFGRPAHLDGRGWTRLGLSLAVGAGLYAVRDDVREFALDHEDQTEENVLNAARYMSRTATPLVIAGGLFIAGAVRDSPRSMETGSVILESLAFASVITGLSQRVLATERPRRGDDINWFGGREGHSVSGDVTIAASMLAPIIDRYLLPEEIDSRGARAWKRTGAVALYSTVGLIALQRIHVDAHYLPDVYLGYLNGLMVGKMVVDSRKGGREWRDRRRARRVEVSLSPGGVTIAWPHRPPSPDAAGPAGRR